jgi:hypothetical protein
VFCTGRVQKLRRLLNFHHRQSKSGKHYEHRSLLSIIADSPSSSTAAAATNVEMETSESTPAQTPAAGKHHLTIDFLEMALFEAERAWAFGMEHKQAMEMSTRHRHDAIKRLRRASQYASQLTELCRHAVDRGMIGINTLLDAEVIIIRTNIPYSSTLHE